METEQHFHDKLNHFSPLQHNHFMSRVFKTIFAKCIFWKVFLPKVNVQDWILYIGIYMLYTHQTLNLSKIYLLIVFQWTNHFNFHGICSSIQNIAIHVILLDHHSLINLFLVEDVWLTVCMLLLLHFGNLSASDQRNHSFLLLFTCSSILMQGTDWYPLIRWAKHSIIEQTETRCYRKYLPRCVWLQ